MLILESLNLVSFPPAAVERWRQEASVRAKDPSTWTR